MFEIPVFYIYYPNQVVKIAHILGFPRYSVLLKYHMHHHRFLDTSLAANFVLFPRPQALLQVKQFALIPASSYFCTLENKPWRIMSPKTSRFPCQAVITTLISISIPMASATAMVSLTETDSSTATDSVTAMVLQLQWQLQPKHVLQHQWLLVLSQKSGEW
jgi:hypothetical protein